MSERLSFVVSEEDRATRIDVLIARKLTQLSRRQAARLCQQGLVSSGGRRVGKSAILAAGSRVEVHLDGLGAAQPAPDVPLHVVLERPDLLIVDKPAGVPCAALPGREGGTLAGALLSRYPELAGVGYGQRDPGLLHRLDTQTSGLVLVARTGDAFFRLSAELRNARLTKRYLALVAPGVLPNRATCALALAPDPRDARRVAADPSGRPCRSEFRVLRRGEAVDLVEVTAPVAYRHQVRVHAAALGAPLAGDPLYGDFRRGLRPRHALHACEISGSPDNMEPFAATAQLPEELTLLL